MMLGPRSMQLAACLVAGCWAALAVAQPVPDAPRRTVADGFPGVGLFLPERWGIVGVTIANPTDRPAQVVSAHYFNADPALQFARDFWVPAQAQRSSWYPVLPPPRTGKDMHFRVKSHLSDRSSGREVLLRDNAGGTLVSESLLPSHLSKDPVTGLLGDPDDESSWLLPQAALVALRRSPRLAALHADALPPTPESLHALDHLVVSSDRPADDAAGFAAIRGWLRGGGRLWIRLDRVSPATVALLLGEDLPYTVVDRVGVTRWQIQTDLRKVESDEPDLVSVATTPQTLTSSGMIQGFEAPVEMARVLAPGVAPMHSIDGWPVSFQHRQGRGVVLFTTLGPRGWVMPRAKGDKARYDGLNPVAEYKESEPLRELASTFLRPREAPPLRPSAFGPLLAGQVGYEVVGRGTVVFVLSLFCLGLAAAGWWLKARGDLAHLGWLGPAAALSAAGVLVAVGQRGRVPATAAVGQFVEAASGAQDAAVTGMLALYNAGGDFTPLGSERGGIFLPDRSAQGGATRRLVWTDLDCWHWDNLALPPGLHLAPFETTARLTAPLAARVTFDRAGAVGNVDLGPFKNPSAAILALPSRRNLAVRLAGSDGAFTATAADQLAPGQYTTAGLVSEEQGRQRVIYKELLEQRTWPRYPMRPMFLAWTQSIDLGFTFPSAARQTGAALVALPLELERPAADTSITIPAPFLPYKCLSGDSLALLYDPNQNDWVSARAQPSRTVLRFQIPPQLLPVRIESAILDIDVTAPSRSFKVLAGTGKPPEVLAEHHSPVGRLRVVLDRPELLKTDSGGALHVGLAVGAAPDPAILWKINDLQLELKAVVQPPS